MSTNSSPSVYIEELLWRKDPEAVEGLVRDALALDRPMTSVQRAHLEVALAYALIYQHRFDAARAVLDAALARTPDDNQARLCGAQLAFFTNEAWPGPWDKLEARWEAGWSGDRPVPADRLWDGGPLDGRSVWLAGEGGLGDQIQFVRFAPALKRAGASRVTVSARPALVPLLTGLAGIDAVAAAEPTSNRPERPLEYDVGVPMMSAPRFLCPSPAQLPPSPRPHVPHEHLDTARRTIARAAGTLNVGLCWTSNYAVRGLPLALFRPLAGAAGIRLFALGERRIVKNLIGDFPIDDLSAVDLVSTAAAIEALDVIVTVDTMVVHLAGALGKPVWLLLHALPGWRWPVAGETTPWYPTVRLLRQESREWQPVVDRLVRQLQELNRTN